MKTLPFVQVDAFTKHRYSGNPCAVVFEADDLTVPQMQIIAKEMNLSETAFVMKSDKADLRARYFTPFNEIPLAGHPTISTIFAVIETDRLKMTENNKTFLLQLEVGVIEVNVERDESKNWLITMSQKPPQFMRTYDPEEVLPVFSLTSADLLSDAQIMTVSTGTPQLMIPLNSLDSLKRIQLRMDEYQKLKASGDFYSPHLFITQGIDSQGDTFARHVCEFEDPFTGSATGGMAAYLWNQGLINNPKFIAQQGHWMGRPGDAFVEVVGSRETIETVKVGGNAVKVMEGNIIIPETEHRLNDK